MKITDNLKRFSTACCVTQQQAQKLNLFSQALQAFNKSGAEVTAEVAGAGLAALEQIANSRGEADGQVSWRAFLMKASRLTGSSLVVEHESGETLTLQMDAAGQAYIGSYSNLMADGDEVHAVTFDLKSSSTGRRLHLLGLETTAEILLDENDAGGLHWTSQPDKGKQIDVGEITDDNYIEMADALEAELDEEGLDDAEALFSEDNGLEEQPEENIDKPTQS